jgi:hypothetical protein
VALAARLSATATVALHFGTFAIFHLTLTLALAALVLNHLLLGLVLLAVFAHGLF